MCAIFISYQTNQPHRVAFQRVNIGANCTPPLYVCCFCGWLPKCPVGLNHCFGAAESFPVYNASLTSHPARLGRPAQASPTGSLVCAPTLNARRCDGARRMRVLWWRVNFIRLGRRAAVGRCCRSAAEVLLLLPGVVAVLPGAAGLGVLLLRTSRRRVSAQSSVGVSVIYI